MSTESKDVLEQNVSTLLESGGEPPRIADAARTRIREALITKHGRVAEVKTRARVPLLAVGIGLAATAATALVVTHFVGGSHAVDSHKLADGSTYIARDGAKVTVLGNRRVRVEGEALLDVAPGKGTFVVETARGTIEVLGTRFYVDGAPEKTLTAVVRGEVKLATSQGSVVVHAGEQAVAEPGRPPVRGPAPRLSHLVSWAQAERRREEGAPEPVRHGTLFARDPGVRWNGTFGEEQPLPLAQLTLDVEVDNQVARVALDQTFHNPQNRVLEGVYKFTIPPDAALQRFAMYVDGKLTESAVVERMRARRIYEELVYRRVDPGLLEYAGTGRLNLRVYPLPPNEDKRLVVAYTQSLPKLYSDWTLAIPLPEVDQPVGDMLVSARIKGCANCELSSPSHKIEVERSGNDAVVKYHRTSEKIGDTFVVHVRDAHQQAKVATLADGKDNYMLVRAPVELGNAPREYRPRTWVILDDVSASRSALELKAQADLVDAFLRELDENDKVALVAFDVEARQKLAPTRVMDVDRRVVRQALKNEGGVGATDFEKGLAAAMKLLSGVNPDDAMVVYLGDGVITSGPRQLDVLRQQLAGKAHFVGVGVGDGPDTQTLDALAAATGGYATTLDMSDDLGWRAFDLIAALHTSRVTGVSAKLVDASGQLVPATAYLRSPQLADGEELELVAKLAGDGTPAAVELTGTRDGQPWQQKIALANATSGAGYLPRMWAAQHIAARLLAKHEPVVVPPCAPAPAPAAAGRRGPAPAPVACPTEAQLREQRDEQIRQEVVTLGKQYFLLSRHTSLLVLENDAMYAKYGVRKGGGDTWAPYALPATIKVVKSAVPAQPSDVADDAELVREPLQIFYSSNYYGDGWEAGEEQQFFATAESGGGSFGTIGLGRFGTIGHGGGGTGSGYGIGAGRGGMRGRDDGSVREQTRATLGLVTVTAAAQAGPAMPDSGADLQQDEDRSLSLDLTSSLDEGKMGKFEKKAAAPVMSKRARVSGSDLTNPFGDTHLRRWHANKGGGKGYLSYGVGPLQPMRLTYPTDQAFDDVTAFIPALVPDDADDWRDQLHDDIGRATDPMDDAAKKLLDRAHLALPVGIYRWNNLELAVDAAHHLGWRRTTDANLAEVAGYDGATFVRRYPELGLSVTREMRDDAFALAMGYLPIWIADPAQYAHWFAVKSVSAREVALQTRQAGKRTTVMTLTFDDSAHLTTIADDKGTKLLEVTWTNGAPTAAKVAGDDISVGFTPDVMASATAWVESAAAQSPLLIELPTRIPSYWKSRVDAEQPGSPAWRHAQRQLMASAAAINDRSTLYRVYDDLRTHGGVELGDLALASGGIATGTTDAQFAESLAPASITKTPLAHYLLAGRAYGKAPTSARMKPETVDGLVGALWSLRSIDAKLAAGEDKPAVDELVNMGSRAFLLRLVGAAAAGQRYTLKPEDITRAWDSVALGGYKNVAQAQAVQVLLNRGAYDAAADRFAKLANELDLHALPPQLNVQAYTFNYSRRGQAGYQLIYATLRDRILAGTSFAHVMALVPQASQHTADLSAILARASALAGTDADKQLAVARTAIQYGQQGIAQSLIEPMVKQSPTRELLQLAASMAQQQGRIADALAYLEKAQTAGANEEVEISTVRAELTQILALAQQLATQSSGATRKAAVDRAMEWATRWRQIDPGNADIDRQVGELMLAVGDSAGAWRQLSSAIERDPWSSAGYTTVADTFERQGKVADALDLWQQAIVIDQTNPTPRLRKAQALIALGRTAEGDALLDQIANATWHPIWTSVVYQAKDLIARGKQPVH